MLKNKLYEGLKKIKKKATEKLSQNQQREIKNKKESSSDNVPEGPAI